MLTYNVLIGDDNIKREELVWREKYVSPDLSFVTGVTSQEYHIDKSEYISASIGNDSNFSRLNIECENVTRNGYVVVKAKKYRIQHGSTSTVSYREFKYIDVNGVYYYITEGEDVIIKNWQKEVWKKIDGEYVPSIIETDVKATYVTVENGEDYITLDTVYWIEDETVTIDGEKYIFDQYDMSEYSDSPGGLKYYEGGRSLRPSEVTPCDSIYFNHFDNVSKYIYVTKFKLTKDIDKTIEFDRITYCTYFYYINYKDYYCPVKMIEVTEGGEIKKKYICEIPTRLLPGEDENSLDTTVLDVEIPSGEFPTRISQLKSYDAYVIIDGYKFPVKYILQNANSGDELAVYVADETHNIAVGDKLTLSYDVDGDNAIPVYSISGYDFVMYDNAKYPLEENIADTVKINGIEYDVSYPYGKVISGDALVNIDGENIPMKILEDNKLERYGLIVTGDTSANTAIYSAITYSGVSINGNVYRVIEYNSTPRTKYIYTDFPVTNEFFVNSIEGSSLLICVPNFNYYEYDQNFIDEMSPMLCEYYVNNSEFVKIHSKNRAFGIREITPNIGLIMYSGATSSNDYYDILEKLKLYTNTGYIQLKLPLTMNVANNAMQEDIVERDFYNTEKEKAINPIVDMEKDVYVPMFMEKKTDVDYKGSSTNFSAVTEIEVNLHFRTRNLDSWRVNDGNANIELSGVSDNWFCTDYYPYAQMLSGITNADEALMNSSDLMGLLYFENNDVFYQKDNIAKSFLRFSYYDSPDPNTQSLLCTSTVFMDEHAMYKKYIDNSRRNIRDYGIVEEQEFEKDNNDKLNIDGNGDIVIDKSFSGSTINRVSVLTECVKGKHKPRRGGYNYTDIDIDELREDKHRISSKFIINNKYATDTSSEGFYLYMFREYSENLHPKPIYMKVEFNHAGIGRVIPFIIPMHWSTTTESNNEAYPVSALTLSRESINELKTGYPLSYVYAQTYIPLYAVYDYKHKQYAYVFDDRYIKMDGSRVILNMFEIKIQDENTATQEARERVRNNNIDRANINVNKEQFNENI